MAKKTIRQLTLKDRLSRLTYREAIRVLDPQGEELLRLGRGFEIDIPRQVFLDETMFRLTIHDAVVTIRRAADQLHLLEWNCTGCGTGCEHIGAAFSLILEEKMALGLAEPPRERKPVESLGEKELVEQAIAERRERAAAEKMKIQPAAPGTLWGDYVVTSLVSGQSYRVSLRGWSPGDSYCACPDFRKNTLGTCKHLMKLQEWTRRRFDPAAHRRPFVQKDVAVHLRYGPRTELRLLAPGRVPDDVESIIRPIRDKPITDVHGLLKRVRRIEAMGRDILIYPDAQEFIDARLFDERMSARVAEIRADPARHPLRRELLRTELLPYQLDGIAFAAGAGRAILADDMGLGKTIQGIGVAELLAREADVRKVLVVCPASLKCQWRSEVGRFSRRDCQLVLGATAQRAAQYANSSFFTICNYEQVLRDILAVEKAPWDLIILDEGQRIKNWQAQTSRIIKGLRSRFALVLSGTPLENRLDDLFSVIEFIDDRRLGPAFRFFNRHRVVDEKGKPMGYKNLGELRERLKPVLLRRTRESVMQELPKRSTEYIRISPTQEQLVMHRSHMSIVTQIVNKKYISEMDLLRLQRELLMCRMVANSTFLVDKQTPAYSSKLPALDDLFDRLLEENDRKIVLFSEWTTMLDLIEKSLKRRRVKYVRLDGSVPQMKRQSLVHQFQTDPECRLFITTNAGSTGLNLQAANTVINVDLPWNPAVLEQRIARAHRMGQKRPVQVYVFVTEQTIEERLLKTLDSKRDLALAALDAQSDVDTVDMASGISDLRKRLEVLLGEGPPAPIDESERLRQASEAQRLANREKVAAAGGQLFSAAFTFLSELLPAPEDARRYEETAGILKQRLAECVETGPDGQMRLTLKMPDPAALDVMAGSLARLLAARPTAPAA